MPDIATAALLDKCDVESSRWVREQQATRGREHERRTSRKKIESGSSPALYVRLPTALQVLQGSAPRAPLEVSRLISFRSKASRTRLFISPVHLPGSSRTRPPCKEIRDQVQQVEQPRRSGDNHAFLEPRPTIISTLCIKSPRAVSPRSPDQTYPLHTNSQQTGSVWWAVRRCIVDPSEITRKGVVQ